VIRRSWLPLLVILATAPAARGADHVWHPNPYRVNASDSISFKVRVADANLVGVTLTNYGFVGNNFISRSPSLEYPLGLGYEHMVRGGLWIGARAQDDNGSFIGVTSAAVDGTQGNATPGATEFTPAGDRFIERSTLPTSGVFAEGAVSELDVISTFSDRPAKRAADTGQDHRPLHVIVKQENYAWSFSRYQHSNFFHYTIVNDGPPLRDVWVGFYNEFASGAKKDYATWPPSGWYNKKWIQVDDTLTVANGDSVYGIPPLFREHYCAASPPPEGCNLSVAPFWIGVKLLGWKRSRADTVVNKRPSLSAWSWRPGSPFRNEDVERYDLMSSGMIMPLDGDSLQPSSGDPVAVLSVGPFSQIDPGDTIEVDFALVGGAELASVLGDEGRSGINEIQENARLAQKAYDRHYIVPVPPPSPRIKVVPSHNALDIFWDDEPERFEDPTSTLGRDFEGYRVYIGEDRNALNLTAQFDLAAAPHDTAGFNTGLGGARRDTVIDGRAYRYHHRVTNLRDGFKYFVAVTAFDLGTIEIESLESGIAQNKVLAVPGATGGQSANGGGVTVFPNPYRVEARWDQGTLVRDHYLWFANLPQRAKIRIYTLAGDLVFEADFDGATYTGQGTRGLYDPNRELDVDAPTLSGRMYAWNMITRQGQAAATGLYLYSVEEPGGKKTIGKFLIVKSDREDF
jgi:hypothetical protein